jgi:hypothetical protein
MTADQGARDVIYDVLLSSIGWLPYLKEYEVLSTDLAQNTYYHYDRKLKTLPLPDGYTWGSFIPDEYLYNNYDGWEAAAISFLTDSESYLDSLTVDQQSDWTTANIDNNAVTLVPEWLHEVAERMDMCHAYDVIWPHITLNFRSMPELYAPWNDDTYKKVLKDLHTEPSWRTLPSAEWLTVPRGDLPRCTCCNGPLHLA